MCCKSPFPITKINRRDFKCDSCRGVIGGPRLFCLDCTVKSTESYNTIDLCCAPQCVGARVTHRQAFERPHEPSHRLVKARTPVVMRNHGHAYEMGCEAYQRVRGLCSKIAKFPMQPYVGTVLSEQTLSTSDPTSTEIPARSDAPASLDRTKDRAEVTNKTGSDTTQSQDQDQDVSTCCKCQNRLSFPFWYCIFCQGQCHEQIASPCY